MQPAVSRIGLSGFVATIHITSDTYQKAAKEERYYYHWECNTIYRTCIAYTETEICNRSNVFVYISMVFSCQVTFVTGFVKTIPIGTTIEIHFMA